MKKNAIKILVPVMFLLTLDVSAQDIKPFELSEEWLSKIGAIAPEPSDTPSSDKQHILIFSLHTGFEHWTIPHTEAVVKLIAEKSGDFTVMTSKDISVFEKRHLRKFDAIVLNNNCSVGPRRDLFWDALEVNNTMSEEDRAKKAKQLEKNLVKYVKKGHGLMVLHGSIVMQNNSKAYGEMVGGSFDYHPKHQEIHVKLADPTHPLVQSFESTGFVHQDEPYFFKNAYFDYNFKPLLYLEANKLEGLKKEVPDNIKYVSWIKRYGKGKVFYSSPSHSAQSMENSALLKFFLNGLNYVAGNLECDDSPMKKY
ncbi:ThuA domain-containing protein [Flagellimonas myxillae]|uniref:ThuA domain-containing protein n=1 Tax=Flagellimonas myxillae TaxID=2942214 RepID=UPI00201E93CA|nr:ThuA domain-containing protein [Muricauda myxillae]MCL6265036.1 ThuA domain-containing protein [Muricauda myxillae]